MEQCSSLISYLFVMLCRLHAYIIVTPHLTYRHKKRGARICCSFHAVKALASPKSSKRATPKAPRRMYNAIPQPKMRKDTIILIHSLRYVYKHPKGRSRCFVFDDLSQNCQILTASKPKRTVTPFYVHKSYPPTRKRAFGWIKMPQI